jgi:hypothetical protein
MSIRAPLICRLDRSAAIALQGEDEMRFLSFYRPKNRNAPPSQEAMERMGKFVEASFKSGELVATGGLTPGRTYVRRDSGKIAVTDGPFAEVKELIAGFAILEARSKEHALQMTERFLEVAGDGECELHQIMGEPPR